ncbi:hypothetical protein ADL27_02340 [Streptomyces sp. NRRL F-6602]|nr:hypothetical protein ADL27_02340 [Streptomyces sp. NRRL F-6602]
MTIPSSAWAAIALVVPLTLLTVVIGLIWLIGAVVPPVRQYALDVGRQTTGMLRALSFRSSR